MTTPLLEELLDKNNIRIETNRAVIQVEGADAEKLLQGQLTCDVTSLDHRVITAGHCNPKGRLISNFDILKRQNNCYWLITNRDSSEAVLSNLKKYAVFFKVELSNITDDLQCLSATKSLFDTSRINNPNPSDWTAFDWGICIQRDVQSQNRLELLITHETNFHVSDILEQPTAPIPQALADIRAVRPHPLNDQSGAFIPNHLNYQFIGGISFTKGCYTGQEIIARLHYKSDLKKHTYHFSSSQAPQNDSIFNSDGKAIGEVITKANNPEGNWEFLAIANSDCDGPIYLDDQQQEKALRQPLPYAINEA